MLRLNKLEVRHVRGIAGVGPDLELSGKNLILLGDNATGKSSYIDALEYLLTRSCSSLDISRAGVNWQDGGVHILADAKDFSIKGELGDGAFPHALDHTTDLTALSSPVKEWIKAANQRCFVLRRRTLLRLIEAQPKARYDALSPFFALDKFGAFEKEVKAIAEGVETRVKLAAQNVTIQEDLIRRAFNIAQGIRPEEPAIFAVVNQRLATASKGPVSALDAAARLQAEVLEQMKTFSGVEQAVKLETVLQALSGIPTLKAASEALEALMGIKVSLETLERDLAKGFSVEVLERGKTWILEGSLDKCPLCEQGLGDKDAILARIAVRIKECSAVIDARAAYTRQLKLFTDSLMEVGKACASAQKTWSEKLGQDPATLSAALAELRRVAMEMARGEATSAQLQGHLATLAKSALDTQVALLVEDARRQLKALGGIDQYKNLAAANQALSALTISWPALVSARATLVAEEAVQKLADKALAHTVQARKDAVQTILVDIADEANRIYAELHPDEKIGKVTLKIPVRGEGSVNMESQFFEKRGDARLYFSESHLDTLGVALFLALRKKQAAADPAFKLLVLDDVFHSVDSQHRMRAARLIIKEFKDHQFIITTHDPIWFELLREAVQASGLEPTTLFHRISDWTLEGGPIWGDHEAEFAFLSSARIDTAQPADIAAKAGRLLEELLKPLCDQLQLSVKFRHNRRYDLGALWPSFKKAALKHPDFSVKHGAVVEEIDLTDWVRNEIGAHSNPSPAPPTAAEAKKFAQAVVSLHRATRDPECGRFIQMVPAPAGDWVCRCGTLRYPNQAPAAVAPAPPPAPAAAPAVPAANPPVDLTPSRTP